MKKFLAALTAAISLFALFAFTACAPSAEDTADRVIEGLKGYEFAAVRSDGTSTETNKTVSETVLTKSGERLSFKENTSRENTESHEKYDFTGGGYDLIEKSDGGKTVYSYNFLRGGYGFEYSSGKEIADFSGITLNPVGLETEFDGCESINEVNGAILNLAKATEALSVKGDKLKVDLNAMLNAIVSDLKGIFGKTEGRVTLGKVFADEKIRGYFSPEIYAKITEALDSKEAYLTVAEALYVYSGGLISLPQADTLAGIDLTDFSKEFKEITANVTKKQFIITKSEKDIETGDDSTAITEEGLTFSASGEITFTLNDGAIAAQNVAVKLGVEALHKEDVSLSYAPEKSYVKTDVRTMDFEISESTEYLPEECALTDIGKAVVEYPEYVIADGKHSAYVRHSTVPQELYGALSDGGFNFELKTYVDKNDNVTDVVAEAYSFYDPITSVYNRTEKSLTISGGRFGKPLTLYLNFGKRLYADGDSVLLWMEVYSTAADRDARRLCGLTGEYFTDMPFEDGSKRYYPVSVYQRRNDAYISMAEATTAGGKITGLKFTGFVYDLDCTYAALNGKITVKIRKDFQTETYAYYAGFAADDGSSATVGLYASAADAQAGSDRFEFSFEIDRTEVTKTVTVEEYINISDNKGDLV